jgi:hypothetical protein
MRNFVVKLAAWGRVCKDLDDARLRLAHAENPQPPGQRARAMEAHVRRLERARDQALGELRIAAEAYMATVRQQSASTPVENPRSRLMDLDLDLGQGTAWA